MALTVPKLLHDEGSRAPGQFAHFFRMPKEAFSELCDILRPRLTRQNTVMREAISCETRVAVMLRYLATGCSMSSFYYDFRVGEYSLIVVSCNRSITGSSTF